MNDVRKHVLKVRIKRNYMEMQILKLFEEMFKWNPKMNQLFDKIHLSNSWDFLFLDMIL